PRGENFNMRWVASMVGEVHRILTRGGIFMYPKDTKDPSKEGRLRLMYEANPMGMLIEEAGGLASTGSEPILDLQATELHQRVPLSTGLQRIMDIQPHELHQRVPVILGSKNEVERVASYYEAGA
ncbi:MAG: hypothetical protein ACE5ET_09880, partial [Gammaproteobacteria bacterium]